MNSTPLFLRAILTLFLTVTLLALTGIGCEAVQERISTSTPTALPPTATPASPPTATDESASPAPRAATPTSATAGLVLPVSIAPETSSLPDYDRRSWRHWIDEDSDCQNARQEVLIAESTVPVTYKTGDKCNVATGLWEGPYTGKEAGEPGALDVDHMVPLGNAHRSGAWSWDRERKRDYANYLGYDNHLIATTSSANRSKGSKGPEAWRPPLRDYWCAYATDWVTIKNEWGLTVTEPEYIALSEMLSTCETTVLLQPTEGTPPAPPTPTPAPSLPTDLRYDPFGPDRNCGEFDTYEEALAFFRAAGGPESDPHRLDVNGDGQPCESLPGGPSASESSVSPEPAVAMRSALLPVENSDGTQSGAADQLRIADASPSCDPAAPGCASYTDQTSQVAQHSPETPIVTPAPPSPPPATTMPTPTPKPTLVATPEPVAPSVNCGDFANWQDAQDYFLLQGGPGSDPHGLDRNADGVACQSLAGAPGTEARTVAATATPAPSPVPTQEPDPTPVSPAYADLPFDPSGSDRNCGDFASWWDAQNFYLAAGGPGKDPHRLDHNKDGTVCESLPGAPKDDPEPVSTGHESSSEETEFRDRNCSDFATWRAAQDFYEAWGGPHSDPHRLDRDKDGEACESLPGAPRE